ncbi:TRAP-type C4-dicarboxylate transport system, small permease component [Candidatus Rhodobacter oscarellae]|uniref:TRAP transporter small permease protein n=1 Tax=Candidatus Rhodobacter oscarellae TaxID=1675527 RepID=A0A0J9E754_9RHOB|nr:TRAP transporter small permease [Candidatus Rhodobacter lobularis]KMW58537.1 TRAP-type C4-dicarboxylate transport system, small permease component [Candidatus Rhodobacter lobularis]
MDLFRHIAGGIAIAANAAGTFVVIALIAVVNYDIVARGFFNKPFLGAVEVVQFSMVLIVFLQLPDVVRVGRLTRSDGFLGLMQRRRPLVGLWQSRLIDAASGIFMALVAYAMWPEFVEMWHSQDFFGVPGVFTAPWWPVKLVIFLSACLCAVHFGLKVVVGSGPARQGPGMLSAGDQP